MPKRVPANLADAGGCRLDLPVEDALLPARLTGAVRKYPSYLRRQFCTFPREFSPDRRQLVGTGSDFVPEPDHRLRNLVQRTGNVTVATDLGVPRSTAYGWLGESRAVVVCLDVTELAEPELRQEVLKLRRRVRKLTALLRLALSLLHASRLRLTLARLPDGRDKLRILRAVDRAREHVPLRALLRFLRVSPSWFHAWARRKRACVLDDHSSCPRISPARVTVSEVKTVNAE